MWGHSGPILRNLSLTPGRRRVPGLRGADFQWGKCPLEQLMVSFDIRRAERPGNWPGRNLATRSTGRWAGDVAGRNACKDRAGLEGCNADAGPTLKRGRPGRSGRTRRGSAPVPVALGTDRAAGAVVTTACREGGRPRGAASVGEARGGRECRVLQTAPEGIADHLGVGERRRCRGGRVIVSKGEEREAAEGVFARRPPVLTGTGVRSFRRAPSHGAAVRAFVSPR
jgi:hypothetical protein